jgi:hypothetical protein
MVASSSAAAAWHADIVTDETTRAPVTVKFRRVE